MTSILALSDLHLEFGPFTPVQVACDAVVLAGDISTKARTVPWADGAAIFGCPVLMVMGNHDFYGVTVDGSLAGAKALAASRNVTLLEREQVIIAGIRFLAGTLWTDFRLFAGDDICKVKADAAHVVGERHGMRHNDFWKIRVASDGYRRFRPLDAARLHASTVKWLSAELSVPFDGPTVVVTHHAPSILSIPLDMRQDRFAVAYASNLEWLIEKYQPEIWVHGHIHPSVPDYSIGKTRIVSNPRGYVPGAVDSRFDPTRLLKLDRLP